MKLSACGRFVVLDDLHIDREVFSALRRWSERRGLRAQDAVQLAIVAFTETLLDDAEREGIAERTQRQPSSWPG
ncbi:MAG: hypothetical protein IPG04_09530 [Polyangiaceae bacterium]|nr:hypothetical protein [Polyangiaceae bacterium]